jgi:release factor glutamine methyltransferase
MTAREALAEAKASLLASGREDGGRIALLLLGDALGLPHAALIAALDGPLDGGALARFRAMAERAAAGEPAQYILGHWDFYGRRFITDARALIPRPETELLAEAVLAAMPAGEPLSVVDAGCGTGCIGVTIKLERPMAAVTLCDVSRGALALAGENAGRLGADVALAEADMRRPFPGGPYDIIVSNPPYIDAAGMDGLPDTVARFEPKLALFGGEGGLDFVRALAARAQDSLRDGGRMFVEIGYGQADRAAGILSEAGLRAAARPDYAGIPRIMAARKGY